MSEPGSLARPIALTRRIGAKTPNHLLRLALLAGFILSWIGKSEFLELLTFVILAMHLIHRGLTDSELAPPEHKRGMPEDTNKLDA